jgi:hypothetical protein
MNSILTGAVEGPVDEVVLRRVVAEAGRDIETIYVTEGKANLIRRLPGFNSAARFDSWIALVDLNAAECPAALRQSCLPAPSNRMLFRVAVRAIESWLLADRERVADFLSVSVDRVPTDPDGEVDPKRTLVNIARYSRRGAIRRDVVPTERAGRRVGPAYEARLIEFVVDQTKGWRPSAAAARSDSLRRCLAALAQP